MGNLLTEVALLASYQPAGLYCRMVSALQHLDQVQSLCSPCCADKSEQSSYHNSISLLHYDLLLPFLALHKDAATQFTDRPSTNRVLSLHALYYISIPETLIYSHTQFTNCCVEICNTVTNMEKIYICSFR